MLSHVTEIGLLNSRWQSWITATAPILKNSNDLIIGLSLEGDIVEIGESALKYYGWNKNAIHGKNFAGLTSQDRATQPLIQHLAQLQIPFSSQQITTEWTREGQIFETSISWFIDSLTQEDPHPFGILIIGTMISQNKLLEKQTKELKNYLDTVIDAIPGSVYWKDKNGIYLGCNNVIVRKGNFESKNDLINKTDYEVWPCEADAIRHNDLEVMSTKKTMELEETVILPNGERMYFASVKSPLRDELGEVIGIVGNSLDITELKEAKERAEMASSAKSQFLAVTSHELRVPLTGIISTASMLQNGTIKNMQEVHQFSKIILDAGTYLLCNINSILDFSKLEADKFELKIAPLDLKSQVEEIVALLTASANTKGLDLILHYEHSAPHNIYSDLRAIRQILTNLIGNAIKFTTHGSVTVSVRCITQKTNSAELEIAVEDTGIGIPENQFDYIFDLFSQIGDSYVRSSSRMGTGLGLSIVKKLATLLKGTVTVKSKIGKGSTFYFVAEFPLQQTARHETPWMLYAATVRILVVDDTPRGAIICNHLATTHCDSVSSDKAFATIITAQQLNEAYDVIMMDENLRHVDAYLLLQKINNQTTLKQPLSVLFMTRCSFAEKQKAIDAGFFVTFMKPIHPLALQTALTTAWEKWIELNEQQLKTIKMEKLKVLLIEDDVVVQYVEKYMLEKLGCQVDVADTGEKAIAMAATQYDLIFADIGLPDMDGFKAMELIRNYPTTGKTTPIIALTGHAGCIEKQKCLQAGANEVVLKPVVLEQLAELINRYKKAV